ncbi:hypothetical protein DASC09_035080 [Saccharomycopsis crataegensis]|uniref:Uncharacterized protein n=1 Tax=Saccharomycopsis crataegensis TaxID=43959 RepID=A0AAV5QMS5_9ASCO|nr:hypothetical protein DASC09_035080 [Saccharomycopsis crataegensis]
MKTTESADSNQVFEKFHHYDWENDLVYQAGLKNIYNSYFKANTSMTPAKKQQIITNSKVFYFKKTFDVQIDLGQYGRWVQESCSPGFSNTPEISLEHQPQPQQEQGEQSSLSYDELVELIVAGKEIPGIRKIPNIVLEDQASRSVLSQRRKPWEIKDDDEKEKEIEIEISSAV